MTSSAKGPPLRLLALDGGGIRGLSELLILKEVMHKLMIEENENRKKDGQGPLNALPKPCDYFDLIGGTSTGGIIALMLGRLRMDVETAITKYDDLAKQVFSAKKQWGDGAFKVTTLEAAMKSVVETVTGDSESLLLESDQGEVCLTFVCAKNAHNMDSPVLFRTYQSRETHFNCKIWEAARATSAAPKFFKRIVIGRNQPFIDGGLGRNNPSQVVLEEASALFGARQFGCLVSIGTGQAEITKIKEPGLYQRIIPTGVIGALKAISTDCESTHQTMLRRFANLPNTYFRLNVDQGMQGIQFSQWEKLSNVEAHTAQYMQKVEVAEKLPLLVSAIRVPRGQLLLEQLITPRPPNESVPRARERKPCPLPVKYFKGREEILDKMRKYFELGDDSPHVFVLHGLGGSGKTQIASKFVQESTCFSDVFYIDATNEQTLRTDLEAIVPGNTERSVDASLHWLASQPEGNWLLFFDNADDVNLKLKKFIPQCRSGNILVTTRNRELRHLSAKDGDLNVGAMEDEDAKNLLLDRARAEASGENKILAGAIVQELHYFALAISQAGAYIHCRRLSLSKYRELYQRHRDKLLQNEELQGDDPYERAVYATWSLSYNKLGASARSLLQIFSVLHHEGISEEMFEKAASSEEQLEDSELQNKVTELLNELGTRGPDWSWDFGQVIERLGSYSLIEYDDRNHTYSIHPLVQQWSRSTMAEKQQLMQKCVLSIIGLSISSTLNNQDYKYRRTLLQHISSSRASIDPAQMTPSVLSHLACVYSEQGQWKEAGALEVVVMAKRKQLLGDDHPDTLMSMNNLASTYTKQGMWKEAEALQVVVTEKAKQLLGDDHPHTLTSMANLASAYRDQGKWKEAEALQVVVMEKTKQLLGNDHPDTLTSMAKLASTYSDQGQWKEAEALQVVVMEKTKQLLRDDHAHTLMSMNNLASTYWNQGQWKEAEALQVVVMEKAKQLLGDDHPHTLRSMANLACSYRDQGQLKEAEALEVVVMEKRKQLLGDDHPDTLKSMVNLASTYRKQGQWKEAEALQVVVMEKTKQLRGDDHPDTLTSMANLASTYSDQGQWKEAEALQVVVMEKKKQLLGDGHPDTLMSMNNLASTYSKQGMWKEAEALQVVVMEKAKQLLGDDHAQTIMSMNNLASTYYDQGQWKEAEELQVVVVEKTKRLLGHDHPDTLTSMDNLASMYKNQGKWKEAEALQVVVMEKTKQLLGDDHPHTLTSMADLASTYWNQRQWKEAEELQVVVMEKTKQLLGDDHPRTLTSMNNLASMYKSQGKWKEAEALQVLVMEKRKQLLGDDHPDTFTSMNNLASTYWIQGQWKKAEALQVVVMEKAKQLLGDDHPHTLTSMANLALTYGKQEQWKEAEVLQVVVMEKRKQLLGDGHPDTLTSMADLALTYGKQEQWKEAEALQVVVMEKTKQLRGDDHPDTVLSMVKLALTYVNQGQWKEAEALKVVFMEKRKQLLGDDHPRTLMSKANLAATYRTRGSGKKQRRFRWW